MYGGCRDFAWKKPPPAPAACAAFLEEAGITHGSISAVRAGMVRERAVLSLYRETKAPPQFRDGSRVPEADVPARYREGGQLGGRVAGAP